jgi:hypothetical protein
MPSAGSAQQPISVPSPARVTMGRFESIRSQDTGRQAFERGGQTPSTHLGRSRTVSLRPREVEPADHRDSRCGRASSRKIKKPVEGRFSPLPRSTIPLLVGPRSQRQWHRPLQRSRDASGRTPLRKPASGSAAAASRAPPGLQQRLAGAVTPRRGTLSPSVICTLKALV